MKQELVDLLCKKLRPIGLYLCPQEITWHLQSPDIHILAIVDGRSIFDLHYLPELTDADVRIEVSAVGIEAIENEIRDVVATWIGFLTIAKLRMAEPLLEERNISELRKLAGKRILIRPTLMASMIRAIRDILTFRPKSGTDALLYSSSLLIKALSLMVATKMGRTFLKTSDVLEEMRLSNEGYTESHLGIYQHDHGFWIDRLKNAKALLSNLLDAIGLDHSRLITDRLQGQKGS